jgi:hypothetical protein
VARQRLLSVQAADGSIRSEVGVLVVVGGSLWWAVLWGEGGCGRQVHGVMRVRVCEWRQRDKSVMFSLSQRQDIQ